MAKNSKKAATKLLERPAALVEYPGEEETVSSPCYTFRISTTAEPVGVDVSIDQSDWQPCRESLGFWWFDWSGYEAGEHEAVARARKADGSSELSEPRIFYVKFP